MKVETFGTVKPDQQSISLEKRKISPLLQKQKKIGQLSLKN